ncbi:extracellular solute-binding protein [Mesorhizobium retamae]|uniref:sn-glycerol-3-phosphate-binding periplasmic protein UgpB n=1 Tax=Mesorhizobium retamae TaxID=2912854 RepID=A0ABS9QD48_9HYPH|nr:extracellular solute-binding protein [Mesorhizobium sp. IRAMC:0171]MCG7505343.1 extracellular solute-binding protein [Mesorhizobium sp. IRAMC:0171]
MRMIKACTLPLLFVANTASAEPIKLDVTYSSNAYTSVLEQTVAAFEKLHPDVKIKFRTPVPNTYDELLQTTLRSAAIGDLPDISLQGNQSIQILAARNLAVPLNDLIAKDPNWSGLGYAPSLDEFGQLSGESYALAYATSVPIIYLNIDLLTKAGVTDIDALDNWDDLTAAAKKVQALGNDHVGGLFDYQSAGNWTFQALVTSQGKPFLTADGSDIAFDGESGLKALQILRDFGKTGTVDMTQPQMLQAFASGTVGVFASYSAAIGKIEEVAQGRFKLKSLPWPMLTESGRLPAGGRSLVILSHDKARQKAAWEFAKFLVGPEGQTILVKGVGAVPVNTIAIDRPDLLGDYYRANENSATALSSAARLTNWNPYPGADPVKVSDTVKDYLRRVLINHEDPKTVLGEMADKIDGMIH